ADLSSLSDGSIVSTLSVFDPVGNHWSIAGGDLTLVGTEVTDSNYVQLSGLSTGNLGRLGPNGPAVIDATQTHGITFRSGMGPDTIVAGTNHNVYAANDPHR